MGYLMNNISKNTPEFGYCRTLHIRNMGYLIFIDVLLHMNKIQLILNQSSTINFEKAKRISIGDLILIEGFLGLSQTGEKSIYVSRVLEIKKNISNISYQEVYSQSNRFKNRHIDIALNPKSRQFWNIYPKVIYALRTELANNGFMEFNTGVLQENRDAGLSSIFTTKRKNGREYFLSLTSELKLKRLLASGFELVYEIGQSFRNEGSNKEHSPEFSLLEAYAIGWSSNQLMDLIEQLVRKSVNSSGLEKLYSTYNVSYDRIEFTEIWQNVTKVDDICLKVLCEKFPNSFQENMPEFTWIYKFICKYITAMFVKPVFVKHIPIGFSPFAKKYSIDNRLMEGGIFITNNLHIATFSEDNNDYDEIKDSLEKQFLINKIPINTSFLDVLKFGIPPSAGLGLGLNRLLMLFLDELPKSVRETFLYPI